MTPEAIITLVSAIAAPILTFAGVVLGVWKGRRDTVNQVRQARQDTDVRAKIASEKAASSARDEVTKAWAVYAESMQKDRQLLANRIEALEVRSTAAEHRIDTAEARASIAEQRAVRWESLYRIAVTHLREVIGWATAKSGDMPAAPAELQEEL